jgi:hypothetical protein
LKSRRLKHPFSMVVSVVKQAIVKLKTKVKALVKKLRRPELRFRNI